MENKISFKKRCFMIHVSNSQSMAYSPTNLVNFYDTYSQTYHTYPYKGPPQKILELQIHQPIFGFKMRGVSPYPGNLSPLLSLLKANKPTDLQSSVCQVPWDFCKYPFSRDILPGGPPGTQFTSWGLFPLHWFSGGNNPQGNPLIFKGHFCGGPMSLHL